MDNAFEIPVTFQGDELLFKAKLVAFGYVQKFEVEVNGEPIIFEPDEEGQFRAIIDPTKSDAHAINQDLIKEIASIIQLVSN